MGYEMEVPYSFVEVIWEDASATAEWTTAAFKLQPETVYSYGWLIRDDEEVVTLAAALGRDFGLVGSLQTIPRGMIKEINEID